MDAVAKGGRTVLFVSHNMAAIKTLCKKSILISNGTLTEYNATNKVMRYCLNNDTNEIKHSQCGAENALSYSDSVQLISIRLIDDKKNEIEFEDEINNARKKRRRSSANIE